MSRSGEFDAGYRGSHRPPDASSGSPLHDVESVMPGFYENPRLYATGSPHDAESIRVIRSSRGRPEAPVRVFRAVPRGVTEINPGDWVSTSRSYASDHGKHPTDPSLDWPLISREVAAGELHSEGNSIHEWGWNPGERA